VDDPSAGVRSSLWIDYSRAPVAFGRGIVADAILRFVRTRLTAVLIASGLALAASAPASAEPIRLSDHEIRDKVAGGWIGSVIGGAWGDPVEFRYLGRRVPQSQVPRWSVPRAKRFPFIRSGGPDDIYAEVPFLDAMRRYGVTAGWPEWAAAFGATRFKLFFANERARKNIRAGILPPGSGDPAYNPNAYDIDFQIESDFAGMAAPSQPGAAIDLAWRLGHVMNYGDGVYGGVMVAAMHSTAFKAGSVREIVRAGRLAVPEGTTYRQMIEDVLSWHRRYPRDWGKTWRRLEQRWNAHDLSVKHTKVETEFNIDAKLNGAYVLLALLYGHGDFERTVRIAIRAGQDADSNAGNAASVLGTWIGRRKIPERFRRGIAYRRDLPHTDYTLGRAIAANVRLAGTVTRSHGGETAGSRWTIQPSPAEPPAFEQWPLMATEAPAVTVSAVPGPGRTVSFATEATDADGIRDVWWSFGDLSGARGSAVSHTYRTPGTYAVIVWVSDGLGRTAILELSVSVP
jgi:hypothetical protein